MATKRRPKPANPPGMYEHPSDPVTARVVSSFDDFVGWVGSPPASDEDGSVVEDSPLPKTVEPATDPSSPVSSSEEPRCPSCGVTLPDEKHLVASANLALTGSVRVHRSVIIQEEETE